MAENLTLLATESSSSYEDLDKQTVDTLLRQINAEDKTVPVAVEKVIPAIEALVHEIVIRMKQGGRLFYIGAGTSGRLGVVDASECPPTYGVPHDWVIGLIAGGDSAIRKAVENAEDDEQQAWKDMEAYQIDSSVYREGVIRAIALADIVILVVSKEKYADQSVWDMMSALEALHQPTLICLNKISEGSEDLLLNSLKEKWQAVRKDNFPEVVSLYYQKNIGLPLWPISNKDLLKKLSKKVDHKKQARYEQELVQKHWSEWLEPVISEQNAAKEWQRLVDQSIKQALENYQRDYLNHPHHYETFQHALAELLALLEIPGLAGFLTGTRKVLTWPIRKMMSLGKKRLHIADSSQELVLLNQIAEHTLIQLIDQLMDKAEEENQRLWWKEVGSLLRRQRNDVLQAFTQAALSYHLDFQQDVEKTAQHLYHKLQEQPLILNSLRATRVTADATAIALTLHMGGIGVHDLVFAPAMLTITTLLTESAIGSYMHKVENDLKQQQLLVVKQRLFEEKLGKVLAFLPEQLSSLSHFNITDAQVKSVEQLLTEKRHGLRLL